VRGPDDLATQLVALHTHATLGRRLVDVSSSDRHHVKPWLSARLDYAIAVQDWAQAGFPLLGARIEQLEGRPVATLVYRYREHVIDVFVRPEPAPSTSPAARSVRGFNVATARGNEMQWLATSDLGAEALQAFVDGLARGAVTPTAE
jgi:anti-sigma factor RsiW